MSNAQVSNDETLKRWTAKRWVTLMLEILCGETTAAEAARRHGLTVAEIKQWKERFRGDTENALRSNPLDDEALKDQEIDQASAAQGWRTGDGYQHSQGGFQVKPCSAADARQVREAMPRASLQGVSSDARAALDNPRPQDEPQTSGAEVAFEHSVIEQALGDGYVARVLWCRWLGLPGGGDRLPQLREACTFYRLTQG